MAAVPADRLPRVRIPAIRVKISKQYMVLRALEVLGVMYCKITTNDFLSDDIIASVCVDIPPHGDKPFAERNIFYGEPSKARDEAIESAHGSILSYLQKEGIIFVDDANLQALKKWYKLLEATSWSEAFETKCISQQAQIAAMTKHIQLITLEAPLSSSSDDEMMQDHVAQDIPLVHQEIAFAEVPVSPDMEPPDMQPIIDELIPVSHATPPRDSIISEDLLADIPGSSAIPKIDTRSASCDNVFTHTLPRQALHFD